MSRIDRQKTQLYPDSFALIRGKKAGEFSRSYKLLKEKAQCKTLGQIIKLSGRIIEQENDVNELVRLRSGLKSLQANYHVAITQDHPFFALLRRIMPKLFINRDEMQLLTLEQNIQQLDHKINNMIDRERKERVQFAEEVQSALSATEQEVLQGGKAEHAGIRKLLANQEFVENARQAMRAASSLGRQPAPEAMQKIQGAFAPLYQSYAASEQVDTQDILFAAVLAGSSYAPPFIRQLERLCGQEPGLLFPELADSRVGEEANLFRLYANTVNLTVGEPLAARLDLLWDKGWEALDAVFPKNHRT